MLTQAVLDQVLIGFCPVIDAKRTLAATRLTIFPERPEVADQGQALIAAIAEAFALDKAGAGATAVSPLLLNVASEPLLDSVLCALQRQPQALVVEVPAFLAADGRRLALLQAVSAAGQALAINGRPATELPREVLPCFRQAVVDFHDDRRNEVPPPVLPQRRIATLSSGVRLSSEIDAAFERGASAVIGWPVDDDITAGGTRGVPPEVRGIVELMNRVEREESAERMEGVLTSDPTLAFRLLRYLNSSAFGLRSEVTSFRHALMLLGHQRLKRWLALLLASGSKSVAARPVMFMAARRGLIMEELARGLGDESMRSEMFICGVFSLLDRLLRQPLDELMRSVPVQHSVQQSLTAQGPYTQHLALVMAVEQSSAYDIREAAERVLIARGELNRALLKALSVARELD